MKHEPDLRAEQVSVVFTQTDDEANADGRVVALTDVDLAIHPHEFVALVGASGCGKTTLLNVFAGLIRQSSGSVAVRGEVPRLGDPRIGYVFARDALLPWRTAIRNVEFGLEGPGRAESRTERRRRALRALEEVGLGGFRNAYRRQLSQGMRQRVALARTLVTNAPILLMDEPFAALDAHTKLRLQIAFLRIWEEANRSDRKTVVFVTHDLQEAVLLADRVIVMHPHPGRIVHDEAIALPRPRAQILEELLFDEEFRITYRDLFKYLEFDATAGDV